MLTAQSFDRYEKASTIFTLAATLSALAVEQNRSNRSVIERAPVRPVLTTMPLPPATASSERFRTSARQAVSSPTSTTTSCTHLVQTSPATS